VRWSRRVVLVVHGVEKLVKLSLNLHHLIIGDFKSHLYFEIGGWILTSVD
jgi:hypothetical protein